MRANDLTGMKFGTLTVIKFDKERHENDKLRRKNGEINRVKRFWICECCKCNQTRSIDASNLLSGNTKGCVCDQDERTGLHLKKYNNYEHDTENNICKIYASNTNNVFLIDECDFDNIKNYCWYENKDGYLITRIDKNTQVFLHKFLMIDKDLWKDRSILVDHKSRDRKNNRRNNLRIATSTENAQNSSLHSNNTSGYTGVSKGRREGKWRAYIMVNGNHISLGEYDDINDAVSVRKEAELKYFGEFAPV